MSSAASGNEEGKGKVGGGITPSVVDLLKELVGGVFIAVLLHLGQVTFLRGHGSVHLSIKSIRISLPSKVPTFQLI